MIIDQLFLFILFAAMWIIGQSFDAGMLGKSFIVCFVFFSYFQLLNVNEKTNHSCCFFFCTLYAFTSGWSIPTMEGVGWLGCMGDAVIVILMAMPFYLQKILSRQDLGCFCLACSGINFFINACSKLQERCCCRSGYMWFIDKIIW